MPLPKRIAWFALIALSIVLGCVERGPSPLRPITHEEREMLPPKVKNLLADIEDGKAKGAMASTYSPALAHAMQYKSGEVTTYRIPIERLTKGDGRLAITVVVPDRSGRIVSCGVTAYTAYYHPEPSR
ncbi:MAG TPA: hypothetical protein VM165_03720 [Planctomycetaceae bacterium]|nr:hypothetical protein [Planctomycetaceae bacterium]